MARQHSSAWQKSEPATKRRCGLGLLNSGAAGGESAPHRLPTDRREGGVRPDTEPELSNGGCVLVLCGRNKMRDTFMAATATLSSELFTIHAAARPRAHCYLSPNKATALVAERLITAGCESSHGKELIKDGARKLYGITPNLRLGPARHDVRA